MKDRVSCVVKGAWQSLCGTGVSPVHGGKCFPESGERARCPFHKGSPFHKAAVRAIAVAAAVGWAFTASADIPASAYVQDGLIAQWDGIENLLKDGVRQHDGESTVWSDLTGNGHDFDLSSYIGTQIDGFTANSLRAKSCWNVPCANPVNVTNTRDYKTIEIFAKHNGQYQCLFNSGDGLKKFVAVMRDSVQFYNVKNANYGIGNGDVFQAACVHDPKNDATFTVYVNGVMAEQTASDSWGANSYATCLGRGISDNYKFTGEYYAIRLYSRALTPAEIAFNANLDKMRFEGVEPASLTWSDGYRYDADRHRLEVFLMVSGADGATVSFDNKTFVTATNGWCALGTSVTVYAKPVAGQSIAAWTGLPDGAQVSDDKMAATFAMSRPMTVSAVSHVPMTLLWRGAANGLASVASNWAKDDGSAAALPPQSGDAVHFDKDSPSMTWDLDNVTLASWTQDEDFTGTNTFQTGPVHDGVDSPTHGVLSADGKRRELIVTGDITLNGGVWKHTATPSLEKTHPGWTTGEGVYRLIARAGGNFTVGANAVVSADNAGFRKNQGPGNISSNGAGHGGTGFGGGNGDSDYVHNSYGSVRHPVTQGSGTSYTEGGGAIELTAGNAFKHDGQLSASMTTVTSWYTGSGGSIYLKAGSFSGTGSVLCDSKASNGGSGGGGRIALVATGTGETFDAFTGLVRCTGSTGNSHPGTIYWETPADRDDGGILEIRSRGSLYTGYRGHYTLLQGDEDYTFRKVILKDHVMLGIGPGITLTAKEIVSTGGGTSATAANYIVLIGGKLVVPDATALTGFWMKNDFYPGFVSTPKGADGTVEFASGFIFVIDQHVTFEGTLHMLSGSKVYHTSPDATDSQKFRANFSADDFILDSGASVDVSSKGFAASKGPGCPSDQDKTSRSGSHGGLAHDVGSVQTYGSITRPVTLGSGGNGYAGGGATHITVKNNSVVNGTITANANVNYLTGAGGSVWLETGTLEGAGTICADATVAGNGSSEFYGGGGGRVAVTLTETDADFSNFTGAIRAKGGSFTVSGKLYSAGDGTVYLRKGGEDEFGGTLVIDGKKCANDDNFTDITMDVTENTVGHVVITNGGNLRVRTGATLNVRRSFANRSLHQGDRVNGEASDGTLPAGAVAFVDKTVEATVTGTNTFMCLKCAEPGKTVRFGAAGDTYTKIDAAGSFEVAGAEGTPVFLRGLADATPWLLELRGKANVAYADVKDSNATPGDKVSVDDTNVDSGNNYNWGFVTITPGETITWNGSKGAAWGTADNWDLGRAPVDSDVIVIPAGCDNMPELMEPLAANTVTVAAGATLKLNTFSLTVTNGLDCAGTLVCSGTETLTLDGDVTIKSFTAANSTLVLSGTRSRTANLSGQQFNDVVIAGTEPTLSLADGFSANRLTLASGVARTVEFPSDRTVTVVEFAFSGAVGGEAALTLKGTITGGRWYLNVTGKGAGSGVIVSDSCAVGQRIFAYDPSVEGGSVSGWVFGVSETTWIGGASGNWSDSSKWSGNAVPGADSCVHFTSDATVTLDVDDATAQILDVSGCTVKLKGAKTLTVTSLMEILDGGTLEQAAADNVIHVQGAVFVRSGGVWTHTSNGGSDQGFGVLATVDGDFTIDAGGAIDCYCKGYQLQKGPGWQSMGSHGGRQSATAKPCYGSMFEPATLGSGGNATAASGGGRVRLTVGGTLTVNGDIEVRGYTVVYPGSSGSIWLTVGQLKGTGHVSANGSNKDHSSDLSGCGGRVAIYLTAADDLSAFEGTVSAYGGYSELTVGAKPNVAAGTVYVQGKDVENKHGTVIVDNGLTSAFATSGGADLPVTNVCADVVKDYRDTTFVVRNGGVLYITEDVTISELELTSASRVNLNGHTLTIRSWAHKRGRGWPSNWNAKTSPLVYPGSDEAGNPGQIVWEPRPLALIVR